MGSKPRKAFDGIARPQGFIDDAAEGMVQKLVKFIVKQKIFMVTVINQFHTQKSSC
jgi:hypothetical protein